MVWTCLANLVMLVGMAATASAQNGGALAASLVRITTPSQQGTGVVVAVGGGRADVLTSWHVLLGAQSYDVSFAADPEHRVFRVAVADLVGSQTNDETYGLAAMRVKGAIPSEVRAAVFGAAESLRPLDPVVYAGYPSKLTTVQYFNLSVSARSGSIFSLDRAVGAGASGGAIIAGDKVVGIAGANEGPQTYGVLSEVVVLTLRGWGIDLPSIQSTSVATPTPVERVESTRASAPQTPRPFQNGFLTATVDSVRSLRDADLNLSLIVQLKSSREELLLCTKKTLLDDEGDQWDLLEGTSLGTSTGGYNAVSGPEGIAFDIGFHTRVSPTYPETATMRFRRSGSSRRVPTYVDLTMSCYRRGDRVDEPFTITVTKVPVGR